MYKNNYRKENYDNLLNFLPSSVFYGQRPSLWWTKRHDIDLIVGTYKYGYANYQFMRTDPKLTFHKLEGSYQEFPNADTITRRLKKLIQTIVKEQKDLKSLNFSDSAPIENEPSGWTLEEKQKILELVTDFGIPLTSEGKNDWIQLREKLFARLVENNSHPEDYKKSDMDEKGVQLLEKFVQRLRLYSQQLMESPANAGTFDPDKDGFEVSPETAKMLYNNMNILIFVRKHLLASNAKVFNTGLVGLTENFEKYKSEKHAYMPPTWSTIIHDKGLLYAVSENGFQILPKLSGNKQYGFENITVTEDALRKRLEFLCDFYKDIIAVAKVAKKRKLPEKSDSKPEKSGNNVDKPKKKISKVMVERDEDGNIQFPIVINPSLTILDLGKIEYEKPGFHTEKYFC